MTIKLTKVEREEILKQKNILVNRIELEHNNIPHKDMIGILSKITDRFNIMLEEVFA